MDLYVARNKDGSLNLFKTNELVKNKGKGYWVGIGVTEIPIKRENFPEVSWDDMAPTKLELVNRNAQVENLDRDKDVPGFVRVHITGDSKSNIYTGNSIIVNIDEIETIEGHYIRLKSGRTLECDEDGRTITDLIRKNYESED